MLGNDCMRLSTLPSNRSRRAVPNGGPLLSVAYDLTCFILLFLLFQFGSKKFVFGNAWKCLYAAVDGSINEISSSCVQSWSSSVCSFNVALFCEGFCPVVGRWAGWLAEQRPAAFALPPAHRKKIAQG